MTDREPYRVAALSLGANLGDPMEAVERALTLIELEHGLVLLARSSLYRTEPVGPVDQPDFINACALLRTNLEPLKLLERMRAIESTIGRIRRERWCEREIDIDLLMVEDIVMDTPELVLPHPEMHRRRFVLEPLAEIAPDLCHPITGVTVAQMLVHCQDAAAVNRVGRPTST